MKPANITLFDPSKLVLKSLMDWPSRPYPYGQHAELLYMFSCHFQSFSHSFFISVTLFLRLFYVSGSKTSHSIGALSVLSDQIKAK